MCSVTTEGSGLVSPAQVCSPFRMISTTAEFELVEMESAQQGKGKGLVCVAEGISDLSIAACRKQHSVKPSSAHRHLFKGSLLFSGDRGSSDAGRGAQL